MNIQHIVNKIKRFSNFSNVDYAIVVGSGLMDSIPELQNKKIISYKSLKMPTSKVKGHSGNFIFGTLFNKNVVLVSRLHYYESGSMQNVLLPFKILSQLATKNIILLTSCGAINESFNVGDVVLINDHINFTGCNPLIGISPLKFISMDNSYDKQFLQKLEDIAKKHNMSVKKGVHAQMLGPSYETMAEVNMLKKIGADTVSMSTVLDCIICNYYKIKVIGIASVVNVFNSNANNLTHEEVLKNAKISCDKIKVLLKDLMQE